MEALNEIEQPIVAFALFSIGMKLGPTSFEHLYRIAEKLEITTLMKAYAQSWIDYSKTHQKSDEDKKGESPEERTPV